MPMGVRLVHTALKSRGSAVTRVFLGCPTRMSRIIRPLPFPESHRLIGMRAATVSCFSTTSAPIPPESVDVQAGVLPVESAMQLLDWLHASSGLPWWATILGGTLAVRAALLPLAIVALRNSHRMRLMQPEMKALQDEGLTDTRDGRLQYAARYKELQNKHGVRLYRTFLPILGQMPVFLTFFFTLSEMGTHYPSLAEGGALWFTDLTAPDTTYGLPLITSLTFLGVVEAGGEEAGSQNPEQANMMKNVMRIMAVVMVPLTLNQPQAVFVYWITTNVWSMTQTLCLKSPSVKAALGMPISAGSGIEAGTIGGTFITGGNPAPKLADDRAPAAAAFTHKIKDSNNGAEKLIKMKPLQPVKVRRKRKRRR